MKKLLCMLCLLMAALLVVGCGSHSSSYSYDDDNDYSSTTSEDLFDEQPEETLEASSSISSVTQISPETTITGAQDFSAPDTDSSPVISDIAPSEPVDFSDYPAAKAQTCTTCGGTGNFCYRCTDGTCDKCGGQGTRTCQLCEGSALCYVCDGTLKRPSGKDCNFCNGTGRHDLCGDGLLECEECNGTGKCRSCGGSRLCDNCGGVGDILPGSKPSGNSSSSTGSYDYDYGYDDFDIYDDFDSDNSDDWEAPCSNCGGRGRVDCTVCTFGTCPRCNGDGDYIDMFGNWQDCTSCRGDGDCYSCDGRGDKPCIWCD